MAYSWGMTRPDQPTLPIDVPTRLLTTAGPRFHPRSLAPAELDDGGCFDYCGSPAIFLGRKGLGPLRIAWDTSVLVDWVDHGAELVKLDPSLEGIANGGEREEVRALGALMDLWYTRDIRIRWLPGHTRDFRRRPTAERVRARWDQVMEMASALQCVGLEADAAQIRRSPRWRAPSVGPTADRRLVEEALAAGCHVFLTRDEDDILPRAEQLAETGLAIMSPLDLVTELAASGELGMPIGADGMMCDDHKVGHVWAVFEPDR
jgi:hypothetical protein